MQGFGFGVQGLRFRIYKGSVNDFNKHLNKIYYKILRVQGFRFGVRVQGSVLRVYNALVKYFDKHCNKSYKMIYKML